MAVVPTAAGQHGRMSRSAVLDQLLVDAEILRAQAELTCAESQVVYDAARAMLLSSQKALAAATRTTVALRELADADGRADVTPGR